MSDARDEYTLVILSLGVSERASAFHGRMVHSATNSFLRGHSAMILMM